MTNAIVVPHQGCHGITSGQGVSELQLVGNRFHSAAAPDAGHHRELALGVGRQSLVKGF